MAPEQGQEELAELAALQGAHRGARWGVRAAPTAAAAPPACAVGAPGAREARASGAVAGTAAATGATSGPAAAGRRTPRVQVALATTEVTVGSEISMQSEEKHGGLLVSFNAPCDTMPPLLTPALSTCHFSSHYMRTHHFRLQPTGLASRAIWVFVFCF